jgi:hypothetical protein
MKKVIVAILVFVCGMVNAQEVQNDSVKPISIDSLREAVNEHSMKFSALDEKLSGIDSDLAKLTKIKLSGYIQGQYDAYDYLDHIGPSPSTKDVPVTSTFSIRRARIKFTYETASGVVFALQPEFAFDKVTLRDAYVRLNDRWTNTYSLTLGQFDRPTYESEYSSGSMESLERSRMAGVLYPGERDLGAKIEANFDATYEIPLKLQFAVLNGNGNIGSTTNQLKDVDNHKDMMARVVYSLKFPNKGLGIDFGGHGYFGKTVVLPATPPTIFSDINNNPFTPAVGDKLDKTWFGGETQIYYDFLGGLALKAEYIAGTLSESTNPAEVNSAFSYNKVRKFDGYYVQFIKNVGIKNQLCIRYDVFDPNTKLSGDAVTDKGDLKYSTWAFSWLYYFDDNIKVIAGYTLPINESSQLLSVANTSTSVNNFQQDNKDNTFTIRIQAKF